MEICLFVHSFLDQSSKSCERHIIFNGEFNVELSQHLLSHLGFQLENVNFYAIITSQELEIKPIKIQLFEYSVDILSFLQENQEKTLKKDSIHLAKEENKPPEQGRCLRSRDIVIVEDDEIDLTNESKNLEDNLLEIGQNNENCFFELVCSGCPFSDFVCDTDRIFQWLEKVSPSLKPEGEFVDSDFPTTSAISISTNPVPALKQNPIGDSDILEIKDSRDVEPKNKPPVFKNERKTRPLPDYFKKRIENNMKVINEDAKKQSTTEMLRNGKIKSNLFSTSELKTYGNKINSTPWRREATPPADVIILDSPDEDKVPKSKPLINGYKIPKIKHSVEKVAETYNGECSRSSKYELNLIPIERIPINSQPGTSQSAKSTIASVCHDFDQIEDPGLGNILENFLTNQERAHYVSNNNNNSQALASARKKLGETSHSNSSKDDDLCDWNDQPSQKGSIFSSIKDTVSGFFSNSSKKSVNQSITSSKEVDSLMNSLSKNDDDVSFVGYDPPQHPSSSTSKFIAFPSTSTPLRSSTLPNGGKSYGIFTSKNNRAVNQHESVDPPKRKKGNDNDVVEVIEVQDNSDHEGSSNDDRSERHRRREDRSYRKSSERNFRSNRDRSRSRSRDRYDRRDRRPFYHHDDRHRTPPRYSSRHRK